MRSLGSLFGTNRVGLPLDPSGVSEADVRYLVQDWLRAQAGSDAIYCDHVRAGVALVRVGSPTLVEAVRLLEFDVMQQAAAQMGYTIKRLDVRREG